jgi:hypothetical protein
MPPVVRVVLAVGTVEEAEELAAALRDAGSMSWDSDAGEGSAMVLEARAVDGDWAAGVAPGG